jgi:uncharacterized damage-inducible protein DinB
MIDEKFIAMRLTAALFYETRRRMIDESLPRIEKCLDALTEEEVWYRPNESSNSVGNLVLHLCGNVRQWVISGLGGSEDVRRRQQEFDARGGHSKADLLRELKKVLAEVDHLLDRLEPEDLIEVRAVQGFEETGVSILMHVVEHFSYHTGQISWFVKARKDMDLGYYAGVELE